MTPLSRVLHALDALLAAEDVPSVEEADHQIWSYLSAFDGVSAQARALTELSAAFDLRPAESSLHALIRELLAQHQRRLAEGSNSSTP